MRIVKACFCSYLALCLALAGVVGLSPLLHLWIEHGGGGHAHVHWASSGAAALVRSPAEEHAHRHPHVSSQPSGAAAGYRQWLVHHQRPFELPSVRELSRILLSILGTSHRERPEQGPGHEHHSLAQLMASGLVEQPVPVSLAECVTAAIEFEGARSESICLEIWFDVQMAGRAPPTSLS